MTDKEYNKILREVDYVKGKLTGRKVIIRSSRKATNNNYKRTIGLIGEIQYTGSREYGIKFVEVYNSSSQKGLFYYEPKEFDFIDVHDKLKNGGNDMAVTGNYKVAEVTFLQGVNTTKRYAFALFNNDIDVNDTVLCDTNNGYVVGRVENIIPKEEWNGATVTKEIICKVDFSDFEIRKENRKKKENLKKQMDKIVKENQEIALFQMLAEKDEKMKELLEEYLTILV